MNMIVPDPLVERSGLAPTSAVSPQSLCFEVTTDQSGQAVVRPAPTQKKERRKSKLLRFAGNPVAIPYQEYKNASGRYYMMFYYEGGRRHKECRTSFAALKKRAEEIATNISNGQRAMSGFTETDRARWLTVCENFSRVGIAPETGSADYAALLSMLRAANSPHSPQEAVRLFLESQPAGISNEPSAVVVDEMIQKMEADEPAGSRWIDDLTSRLGRFKKDCPAPLSQLRAHSINAWLEGLKEKSGKPLSTRSRNNYRTALLALVAYAKAHNYLPRAWAEMETVGKAKEKPIEVRIFTPEDLARLLAHCLPNLQPFLAIQAFAGIRHEELQKMDWRHIRLDQLRIYVPAPAAKGNTPARIIPIQPNLAAWLKRHHKRNGAICELDNIANALRRTAKRAKVAWKRNALRKSFISYRLAKIHDIGKVAQEAGNSPTIIKKNYELPIPEEEADRWFALNPPADGVVDLWEWAEQNKRAAAK